MSVRRPIPVSFSQTNRSGTAPASPSSFHIPPSRSGVVRDGNIRATMNREMREHHHQLRKNLGLASADRIGTSENHGSIASGSGS